jgi:hypothetical protein
MTQKKNRRLLISAISTGLVLFLMRGFPWDQTFAALILLFIIFRCITGAIDEGEERGFF